MRGMLTATRSSRLPAWWTIVWRLTCGNICANQLGTSSRVGVRLSDPAFDFQEHTHAAELLVPLLQQRGPIEGGEFAEHLHQVDLQARGHLMRIAMCTAQRFLEDRVDDAEFEQVFGGETQGTGRARRVLVALPQNARTAFGADDGIPGMLQNGDAVPYPDPQRAAAPPFADDRHR